MAHYSWYDSNSRLWRGHGVACFISPEKKFILIEPQSDTINFYSLPKDNDLNFVYIQGLM